MHLPLSHLGALRHPEGYGSGPDPLGIVSRGNVPSGLGINTMF